MGQEDGGTAGMGLLTVAQTASGDGIALRRGLRGAGGQPLRLQKGRDPGPAHGAAIRSGPPVVSRSY